MTALSNIRMLTRYTAWANDCLFEALSSLPAGEALKQRATLFGNMVHTMNHAYVVDLIWQAHLEGRPHGFLRASRSASSRDAISWTLAKTVLCLDG